MAKSDTTPFTLAERALIRLEFMVRFGQEPSVTEGIWLRKWRGGPQAGQPRIPAAVASMLERGLVEIGPDRIGARARFTPSGYQALRILAQDRRALDPREYGHLRRELGVEPTVTGHSKLAQDREQGYGPAA